MRARERAGESLQEPGRDAAGQWRPCDLALTDQPDYAIKGRVDYVSPALNNQTGTLRVRTRFENEDETLLAGYFARVRFPMSSAKALLVPEAALLSDQQGRYALRSRPGEWRSGCSTAPSESYARG